MSFPGRIFVGVLILAGSSAGLCAQEAPAPQSAAASGYVPQGYVPLYSPSGASAAPSDMEDQNGAAAQKKADEETPPDTSKPVSAFNFQPLTVAPRADGGATGFAPVVAAPDFRNANLVDPDTGMPRLYAPGFRLGPFDVRPDAGLTGTYNDNIYLVPHGRARTSDYIISVSPRVDISYENGSPGDMDTTSFDVAYAPTLLIFTETSGNSSLNQALIASLAHRFTKFMVNLNGSYAHTSGGVIEGGDLVDHDAYNASLDLSYVLTPKISANWATSYGIDRFSAGIGSEQLYSAFFLNYEVLPKLTISVAPTVNYLTPQETSNDEVAVGAVIQATYNYSDNTSFFAQIGGDERRYADSDLSNEELNYALGVHWTAGPRTVFGATASRKTQSSVLNPDQNYVASDVGVSVQQGVADRITAIFACGYEHADYYSTITGAGTQTYNFFSVSPGLTYHPTIWCDLGISYAYRQNISNLSSSEFTNNQVSLFSTVRF